MAIKQELSALGEVVVEKNLVKALAAFDQMEAHAGSVTTREEVSASHYHQPKWIASGTLLLVSGRSVPVEPGRHFWRILHCSGTTHPFLRPLFDSPWRHDSGQHHAQQCHYPGSLFS